jgi:anti-sigma factor RsiW
MEMPEMRCEEVREALPAYARAGDASLGVRRHLSGCPGCTEELKRYETMLDALGALRSETIPVPVGLVQSLKAIPANETRLQNARTHVVRHRRAYFGGLAVAAVGAGAILWRSRLRAAPA